MEFTVHYPGSTNYCTECLECPNCWYYFLHYSLIETVSDFRDRYLEHSFRELQTPSHLKDIPQCIEHYLYHIYVHIYLAAVFFYQTHYLVFYLLIYSSIRSSISLTSKLHYTPILNKISIIQIRGYWIFFSLNVYTYSYMCYLVTTASFNK